MTSRFTCYADHFGVPRSTPVVLVSDMLSARELGEEHRREAHRDGTYTGGLTVEEYDELVRRRDSVGSRAEGES